VRILILNLHLFNLHDSCNGYHIWIRHKLIPTSAVLITKNFTILICNNFAISNQFFICYIVTVYVLYHVFLNEQPIKIYLPSDLFTNYNSLFFFFFPFNTFIFFFFFFLFLKKIFFFFFKNLIIIIFF